MRFLHANGFPPCSKALYAPAAGWPFLPCPPRRGTGRDGGRILRDRYIREALPHEAEAGAEAERFSAPLPGAPLLAQPAQGGRADAGP